MSEVFEKEKKKIVAENYFQNLPFLSFELCIFTELNLPGFSISSVKVIRLKGSFGVDNKCLVMCFRSMTLPEVGSNTGSSISSHIMGSESENSKNKF